MTARSRRRPPRPIPPRAPYARFDTHHLTLRDVLAVDRTIVANERTLLGYVRTALALLAAGGSLLHFMDAMWSTLAGTAFVIVSLPVLVVGLRHYVIRRRDLAPLMVGIDEAAWVAVPAAPEPRDVNGAAA